MYVCKFTIISVYVCFPGVRYVQAVIAVDLSCLFIYCYVKVLNVICLL